MAAPPRPISLRSCVANLLKWDRQALTLTLTLTLNPSPSPDLLRWERQAALQGGIEEGSLREMAAAVVDMAERRRAAQGAAAVAAPAAEEPKQEPKQPGVFDGIRF